HPILLRDFGVNEENKDPHSSCYRSVIINTSKEMPADFKDKRVVIVGCGNSAMDISVELSETASSQVYICVRREPKIEPSNCHPTMKTNFYERLSTGTLIVKPNIAQLNEDGSIEFMDGTKVENVDVVIYATGYQIEFPFLDRDIVCDKEVLKEFDEEYRENLVWLYKRMFPPKYPNIAFIGLVQLIGPIFPLAEMQARYVTSLIRGYIPPHPSIPEMHKEIRERQEFLQKSFYIAARHTIQGYYLPELDYLGCYPHPLQIIRKYGFSLYLKILFGVPNSFQYRLVGRQSWDGADDAIKVYNGCEPSKIKKS
ncbi:17693_t:CDS:2, partial [Dentiscutata erythropus]